MRREFFFLFLLTFVSTHLTTVATTQDFNGSFLYFVQSFHKGRNGKGTALDLVKMVVETFPSFRDETLIDGHKGAWSFSFRILLNRICGASTPLETRPNPCCRNLGRLLSFTWRQPTHATPNFPLRPGNPPPDHVRGLPRPTDPAPSSHTFLPATSRRPPSERCHA